MLFEDDAPHSWYGEPLTTETPADFTPDRPGPGKSAFTPAPAPFADRLDQITESTDTAVKLDDATKSLARRDLIDIVDHGALLYRPGYATVRTSPARAVITDAGRQVRNDRADAAFELWAGFLFEGKQQQYAAPCIGNWMSGENHCYCADCGE